MYIQLTVKVSEDLLYKSNFSETEIFKVIFVLLNELLSASVQFGYEQSNAGLTGGKTAFESIFIFLVVFLGL